MKRKMIIPAAVLLGTLMIPGVPEAQAAAQNAKLAVTARLDTVRQSYDRPRGNIQNQSTGAQAVVQQVNAARARNGLPALRQDAAMTRAANIRAAELARKFSHTRPNGRRGLDILSEAGVRYRAAGENIAAGQTSAQMVMSAWMGSSGHRANILSRRFGRIGVGQAVINGRTYWVQLFAD